ncbi:hypothetical protein BC833DRAFT_576490 [Globomyces pollinis-pini]|nr:hypothetical protein BC833DRAFT_576490 [Globomyces pollinis-pini]
MGCSPSQPTRGGFHSKRTAADILFDKYDRNRSGTIDKSELRLLVHSLGYRLTEQELELDLKILDLSGDGVIGRDEFAKWWKSERRFQQLQWPINRLQTLDTLNEKFRQYDKDDSGVLDIEEFHQLHKDLLYAGLTTKPLTQALQELDSNNDGKIVFTEYVRYMMNHEKI